MIQNTPSKHYDTKGVGKKGTLVCLAWSSLETEAFPLMFAKPSPRFLLLSQSEGRAKKESKWVEKIWFKKLELKKKIMKYLFFACLNFNLLNGITHSIIERQIFTFIFTLKYRK